MDDSVAVDHSAPAGWEPPNKATHPYPAEVERVLSGYPDIGEIAVIGVPDERWGEAVKAVVAPIPGASIDEEKFLAYARENLAGYKRPKRIVLIDALPKSPVGKILRRELVAGNYEARAEAEP